MKYHFKITFVDVDGMEDFHIVPQDELIFTLVTLAEQGIDDVRVEIQVGRE